MLLDIGWFTDAVLTGNNNIKIDGNIARFFNIFFYIIILKKRASKASRVGTKAGKIVRIIRLIRLVKLYKHA